MLRSKLVCRFNSAYPVVIHEDGGDDDDDDDDKDTKRWKVATVEEAVLMLRPLLSSSKNKHDIIAIDLDKNALTLDDDDHVNNNTLSTNAMDLLINAKAIIWGFEKEGIPPSILSIRKRHDGGVVVVGNDDDDGSNTQHIHDPDKGEEEDTTKHEQPVESINAEEEEEEESIAFIEIPCRSSLNLVAAMSIILHCAWSGVWEGK
uniref:Uncharacterized protein n=1 Tax=Ditylum brightwellii TaxID=49249 RepID=A0A7S2E4M7_9STRA|mmetsp:Transcript_12782/g.19135  ORF Transcript_12782/g.19135 Transcript_12782/m.19135 type:complete len:204 (+) Transcript_12782:746-1357(+)